MKDLKLVDDRLAIENFDLVLVDGVEATVQRLNQKFRLWLGEWFLDTGAGVPWIGNVLAQRPRDEVLTTVLREVLLNDPDVSDIVSLELEWEGSSRKLTITWQARLTNGQIVSGEVVTA